LKSQNKDYEKKIKELAAENVYLKSEHTRLETDNDELRELLKGKQYGEKEN
jgi:hypothetical protein